MKITRVTVDDPAQRGFGGEPNLVVYVDEEPNPTGDTEYATTVDGRYMYGWRHFGPFVRFVVYPTDGQMGNMRGGCGGDESFPMRGAWSSRAGAFNVDVMPNKHVMDIVLMIEGESIGTSGWALEIDRAERDIKKHAPDWRLAVSVRMAKLGDITWVPEELIPQCMWRGKLAPSTDPVCGKSAYHAFLGRDLALCDEHKATHDRRQAEMRMKNRR